MTLAPTQSSSSISADDFRHVIGHFASGVTVVTVAWEGELYGTTASALSSLSLEPPMVVLCMNRDSSTGTAIRSARQFAVNILSEDQRHLAERFARKHPSKFDGVDLADGVEEHPLLAGAIATLQCTVVEETVAGTHNVFLAEVTRAAAGEGAPLAYYRGRFGRLVTEADNT